MRRHERVSPETRITSGMPRRKRNEILRFNDLWRARSPRKKEAKKDGYKNRLMDCFLPIKLVSN